MNYDNQHLGTENYLHPFNQPDNTTELSEVALICETYGLGGKDTALLLEVESENEKLQNEIFEIKKFLLSISEMLENSNNGIAILCKNKINGKLKK